MKAEFHLLDLQDVPILQQLQLEEALLRADKRNWCLINKGSLPAIVMGISSKYHQHINAALLQNRPIPVIRRFSGGGVVFIDPATHFYTLIGNRHLLDVPCTPQHLLSWTERLYAPAFGTLQFALRENDYVIGTKKFGGNAQYLCKDRWLHHSSLLWNYNPADMEYLSLPPKMPAYREARAHAEFLCALSNYFASEEGFKNHMLRALKSQFTLIPTPFEVASSILNIEHRRSTVVL